MSTIDLYAVLGVAPDASTDEIRAAWKAAVADLDPTDPKLNVFNQAGAVLLDPAKREAYDAELGSEERSDSGSAGESRPADTPTPLRGSDRPASPGSAAAATSAPDLDAEGDPEGEAVRLLESDVRGRDAGDVITFAILSAFGLTALAVVTVLVILAAVFAAKPLGSLLPPAGVPESQQRLVDAADAAEDAAVPVLSYDYRRLAQDKKAASARMTASFSKDYEQTFTLIEQNAPQTEAVVTAKVLGSAIARSSEKGVDVLLFVDRPTTRKGAKEPVVYRDQVTFSMRLVDGEWLVHDMRTTRPA